MLLLAYKSYLPHRLSCSKKVPLLAMRFFPLLSLPPEIVHVIASILPARDIKRLRLVNNKLNAIASAYLFETIFVELLPGSLAKLSSVARHPVFSKSVRTIFFSPLRFRAVPDLARFEIAYLRDREFRSWGDSALYHRQCKRYYRKHSYWAKVQDDFLSGLQVGIALREAFQGCPKLRHVRTTLLHDPLDQHAEIPISTTAITTSDLRKVTRHTWMPAKIECDGHTAQCCDLLMQAASLAGVELKTAWFSYLDDSFLSQEAAHCSVRGLESLKLNFQIDGNPSERLPADSLKRFLTNTPMLRELEITSTMWHDALPFRAIGLDLHLAHLKSLVLGFVEIHEPEFVSFVTAHQPTLVSIQLEQCFLGTGTWSSMYKQLERFFPDCDAGCYDWAMYVSSSVPYESLPGKYCCPGERCCTGWSCSDPKRQRMMSREAGLMD